MYIRHKSILYLELNLTPKVSHYLYAKSPNLKSQILVVLSIADKGYSICIYLCLVTKFNGKLQPNLGRTINTIDVSEMKVSFNLPYHLGLWKKIVMNTSYDYSSTSYRNENCNCNEYSYFVCVYYKANFFAFPCHVICHIKNSNSIN